MEIGALTDGPQPLIRFHLVGHVFVYFALRSIRRHRVLVLQHVRQPLPFPPRVIRYLLPLDITYADPFCVCVFCSVTSFLLILEQPLVLGPHRPQRRHQRNIQLTIALNYRFDVTALSNFLVMSCSTLILDAHRRSAC